MARRASKTLAVLFSVTLLAACGEGVVEASSEELVGAEETGASALSGATAGMTIRANANVNVRTGASTGHRILLTAPDGSRATLVSATPSNGFYRIRFNGTEGWSYGRYWDAVAEPGASVRSNGNVNLRTGPGTNHSIILTVPRGETAQLLAEGDTDGWLRIRYDGRDGWSYGQYWDRVGGGGSGGGSSQASALEVAMSRAASGVGFSYWWGGGRWTTDAGADPGTCYAADFNEHRGPWGADCSGFVAKVWQVPGPVALETQSHPYSTWNFYNEEREWRRIDRGNVRRGDAMVYRADGGGHIFLYERGDAWGQMWTYEARSCDAGIVHNLRTASSSYRAIRRAGF